MSLRLLANRVLEVDGALPSERAMRRATQREGRVTIFRLPKDVNSIDFLQPVVHLIRDLEVHDDRCSDVRVLAAATRLEVLDVGATRPRFSADLTSSPLHTYSGIGSDHYLSALRPATLERVGL